MAHYRQATGKAADKFFDQAAGGFTSEKKGASMMTGIIDLISDEQREQIVTLAQKG